MPPLKKQFLTSRKGSNIFKYHDKLLKFHKILPRKEETLICLRTLKEPAMLNAFIKNVETDFIDFINTASGKETGVFLNRLGVDRGAEFVNKSAGYTEKVARFVKAVGGWKAGDFVSWQGDNAALNSIIRDFEGSIRKARLHKLK